jgi:hypothetical protein
MKAKKKMCNIQVFEKSLCPCVISVSLFEKLAVGNHSKRKAHAS